MGKSQVASPTKEQEASPPRKDSHAPSNAGARALENMKRSCCGKHGCLKAMYTILAIVIILNALVLIAVSVTTAIATKIYSSDLSGRLVAMIILAVTAAVVLSLVIYAVVAIFRNKAKPLHATTVVLVIMAIIQAIIAGVSVRVTPQDELNLSQSLIESFKMARDDNPRHTKMWATTQSDLQCCGVYSSEDYRRQGVPSYFPPDVPISCCWNYDPDRSDLVQERTRQICKARAEFYQHGCQSSVLQVFKETSTLVLSVTIVLIVLEIIEAILGSVLSRKEKADRSSAKGEDSTTVAAKA